MDLRVRFRDVAFSKTKVLEDQNMPSISWQTCRHVRGSERDKVSLWHKTRAPQSVSDEGSAAVRRMNLRVREVLSAIGATEPVGETRTSS